MYRWTVSKIVRLVYSRAFAGDDRIMMWASAPDVAFTFPGHSSFAANLVSREALSEWLARFRTFDPTFEVGDVVVSGPPWHMRVAVRFRDAIGKDYENAGVEWLTFRWGKVQSLEVFLDTERVTAFDQRLLTTGG
jgi:ketosteroid isomerase-like protein